MEAYSRTPLFTGSELRSALLETLVGVEKIHFCSARSAAGAVSLDRNIKINPVGKRLSSVLFINTAGWCECSRVGLQSVLWRVDYLNSST